MLVSMISHSHLSLSILGWCCLSLASCSTYDVIHIASSSDPEKALSNLASYKVNSYKHNPMRLASDIKTAHRNYQKLLALLRGDVGKIWGKDEVITPTNKRYVKYTQNYKSRAIVQFDNGLITVETLDQKASRQSLHNAIVTTLLTPDDPRAVDLYSDKTIRLSGQPYLYGLVVDNRGRSIDTPQLAEAYADHLIAQQYRNRSVTTPKGREQVHYVQIRMVNDYQNRQAKRYEPFVEKYARRYGISKSLVLAVIKTESAFNPYAVSSAPAYGLMQLVPATGGRDAYRQIKGRDITPSREYLFNPENNIELGTAYLNIIARNYLGKISDPVSREYCTISAYNGGAGNVLKLFSKDRTRALSVINALPPSEIYRRLRDEHPRDETRRYLVKILSARKEFVNI